MNSSRKELNEKVAYIKKFVSPWDPNIGELQKFFKDKFNRNIIKVGDHLVYDLTNLFFMSKTVARKFNNDPIQPITITYLRGEILFYTWDKHPEWVEDYIAWDGEWLKYLYHTEIKESELWKNKDYLLPDNPNEYYLQLNTFEIKDHITKYIKDVKFDFFGDEPF